MKIIFFLFSFFICSCVTLAQDHERWQVKLLQDNLSTKIDTNAKLTTIYNLNKIEPPNKYYKNLTRLKFEMQTYTFTCKVLQIIKEQDGDFHIIVQDLNHPESTMIVEVVNPSEINPVFYNRVKKVRDFIIAKRSKLPGQIIEITGIGFFDRIHNQKGRAANGFELHPVLIIKN